MASLPPKLAALVDTVSLVSDRSERIALLIDLAQRHKEVPAHVATRPYAKAHRTPACESDVYVWSEALTDDTLRFHFAVENPQGISAKALAVVLDQTLSGIAPEQVADLEPDFVHALFGNELSMGKSMGLIGMVSMVRRLAKRHLQQADNATPKVGD